MHEQDVDTVEAEALQAVVERAPDRVVAIVVVDVERHRRAEAVPLRGVAGGLQQPAGFGGQNISFALPPPEHVADTALAQTLAVVGGRIEITEAGVPCRVEESRGIGIVERPVETAERRTAEAEDGDREAGRAYPALLRSLHVVVSGGRGQAVVFVREPLPSGKPTY